MKDFSVVTFLLDVAVVASAWPVILFTIAVIDRVLEVTVFRKKYLERLKQLELKKATEQKEAKILREIYRQIDCKERDFITLEEQRRLLCVFPYEFTEKEIRIHGRQIEIRR